MGWACLGCRRKRDRPSPPPSVASLPPAVTEQHASVRSSAECGVQACLRPTPIFLSPTRHNNRPRLYAAGLNGIGEEPFRARRSFLRKGHPTPAATGKGSRKTPGLRNRCTLGLPRLSTPEKILPGGPTFQLDERNSGPPLTGGGLAAALQLGRPPRLAAPGKGRSPNSRLIVLASTA
jgi:hypothetical protein